MDGIQRIVRVLESIVRVPSYSLLGVAGNRIVYLSTAEGVVSLWSMNSKGGDRRKLATEVHGVAPVVPESNYVVYTRDVTRGHELHKLFYIDARGGEEKLVADTPLMRIFGIGFDGSRIVFTGATAEEIALYLAKLDGSWEKLYKLDIMAFVTDIEGKYVVGFGNLRKDPRTFELFIYNLETNEFKVYTPKPGSQNKAPVIRNGKIMFESNYEGKNRLYIYDPESDQLEKLVFKHSDYEKYDPVEHDSYNWTQDGLVWAVGKKNGRSKLFLDGKEIKTPEGTIHGYPVFIKDKVLVAVSGLLKPPRVLEVNIKKNKVKTLIDNKLPKEIEKSLGEVKFVKYKSFDGLDIPMYIALSNEAGKPGPTVVYVHGGPWSEVRDVWSISIASLVASGYHVLAPNFRGSTGYGDEFRILDIGDPGGGDLEDVVHAAKWGVENKIADPEKIAIMGYSYGGYMTYLAMCKHPEIWRCGVAGAGVVDWEEMYDLSDAIFRQFIDVLFAGKKELWRERSPITYVDKVKKPLCIIHPQNDTRTPLKPVLRYMNKLLEKNKTFEAHIAPDMGHVIVKMDDAVKILLPALIFLERNLK
ncbi:S9 family peptidase [Desulfurococcaceae archaeon MEX13E-LK6-19]|nr:S9 family peptidase [Desulfurococcaceae archaeon MEX13E-LK6-19]